MNDASSLLEPTFADALAAIAAADDLPAPKQRHWACSLRMIAKALDRPPHMIVARWTSARFPVGRLHHAQLGMTAKTLANHQSNAKAALLWFANENQVPSRGAMLSAGWRRLRLNFPLWKSRSG